MLAFVWIATIVAAITTAPALVIDLFIGQSRPRGFAAGATSFAVTWGILFLYYYFGTPALVGPWWGFALEGVVGLTISAIVFSLITKDGVTAFYRVGRNIYDSHSNYPSAVSDQTSNTRKARMGRFTRRWARTLFRSAPGEAISLWHDIPGAFVAGTLALIMLFSNLGMYIFTPYNNDEAKAMASVLQLTAAGEGQVPPTTPEQLPIVPMEAAQDKAEQGYGSVKIPNGFRGAGDRLSTRFAVGEGNLIFYEQHLFYIFELLFNGNTSNAALHRTTPGYILVDAVNPREPVQVKLGYKMKYASTHYAFNEIDRYIWSQKDFKYYKRDDIKLELDDTGNPFFVGALTKPAVRFSGSVPVEAFWMDAQTGEIHTSSLAEAPSWAERILSADSVKFLADTWGNWAHAHWTPWFWQKNKGNRYEVVGEPEFVYTDSGHVQWQVLMKAKNKGSSSVTHFMILDEHELKGTLYEANGVTDEERVKEVVQDAVGDGKKPTDATLVSMYGVLTWAVPLIAPTDDDKRQSTAGLALVRANSVDVASVVVGADSGQTFIAYHQWIDRAIAVQQSSSQKKPVSGTVTKLSTVVLNGQTTMLIQLDNDPTVRFRIFANTVGMPVEAMELVKGDKVKIVYYDIPTRNIKDVGTIDVLGSNMVEPVSS